jgi:hypothetical protein
MRKWVEQKEFRAVTPHSPYLILGRGTKMRKDGTFSSFKTYRALLPLFLAISSLELVRQQLHCTLHVPRTKNKISRGNDRRSTKHYSLLSCNFFIAMPCRFQQLLKLKRQHSFMQIFHFFVHNCYEYRWSWRESYETSSYQSSTAKWGMELKSSKSRAIPCK